MTFNVAPSGTPPFRYQWQFGGNDIVDATNAWLTLSNVLVGDSGVYGVVDPDAANQPQRFYRAVVEPF